MTTQSAEKKQQEKPAELQPMVSYCQIHAVKEVLRNIRPFLRLSLPDEAPRFPQHLALPRHVRAEIREQVLADLYAWSLACEKRWVADESRIQFNDHKVDPRFSRIAVEEIKEYCSRELREKAKAVRPKAISDVVFGFQFCSSRSR